MEVQEISDRLDYQLGKTVSGIVLDEYNKSLYLTKAQFVFITNVLKEYEYGDAMRHILSPLLIEANPTSTGVITGQPIPPVPPDVNPTPGPDIGFQYEHSVPENILAIVFEVLNYIPVVPLDTNDIHYTLHNPFAKPDENIAYRVTYSNKFDLYTTSLVDDYSYIYCQEPDPIILEDLTASFGSLNISGKTTEATSVLADTYIVNIIDIAASMIIDDIQKTTPKSAEPAPKQGENQ